MWDRRYRLSTPGRELVLFHPSRRTRDGGGFLIPLISNPRQSLRSPHRDRCLLPPPAGQRQRNNQRVMLPKTIRPQPHPAAARHRDPHIQQLPHQRASCSSEFPASPTTPVPPSAVRRAQIEAVFSQTPPHSDSLLLVRSRRLVAHHIHRMDPRSHHVIYHAPNPTKC
jgi:hypothetical protein